MLSRRTLARRLLFTLLPWYLLLALTMTGGQLVIQYFSVAQDIIDDLASLGRTVEPGVAECGVGTRFGAPELDGSRDSNRTQS